MALGSAITAGVGSAVNAAGAGSSLGVLQGSGAWASAGRAALSSGVTQAMRDGWSWKQIVASAVSAGVGGDLSTAGGSPLQGAAAIGSRFMGNWLGDRITSGDSHARSAWNETFGQALGDAIVANLRTSDMRASDQMLNLSGGPPPGPGAEDFYEEFVQLMANRQEGPAISLAGATQYVDASAALRMATGADQLQMLQALDPELLQKKRDLRGLQATFEAINASADAKAAQANSAYEKQRFRQMEIRQMNAAGNPGWLTLDIESASLAATASQPLSPSMQAAGTVAQSALRAAAEVPLTITDLSRAGVGVVYTALTGEVLDVSMYSSMGRTAQEGANAGELLQSLNPVFGLMVAQYEVQRGLERGDTLPLASFSGGLLGGSMASMVMPSMPGYRSGIWSSGTVRAGQYVADSMPRLSPSASIGMRTQMGAVGDLAAARIRLVSNPNLEQARILAGDVSRAEIVAAIGEAVQPSIEALRRLDPQARIGFRGSLASGLKGEHKLDTNGNRVAFDGEVAFKRNPRTGLYEVYKGPQGYDADFFVVSDKFANQLGNSKKFMNAADLNDQILNPLFDALGNGMRSNPMLSGMKHGDAAFRVWNEEAITRRFQAGDAFYLFLNWHLLRIKLNNMTHLRAKVEIPIRESIDEFANRLTQIISGFSFVEEMTGRYEEIPAFVALHEGMEFLLLGVPFGEVGNEYELGFRCRTDLSIAQVLEKSNNGFICQFVREKVLNEYGFVDFSEEFAQWLIQQGICGCKPILPIV